MKSNILFAASALLVLAGCSSENDQSEQQEINFSALNFKPTKAPIAGTTYGSGCPEFGVFATLVKTDKTYASSEDDDRSMYMTNVRIGYNSDEAYKIWAPMDGGSFVKYYWPLSGSLTFIGYTPYAVNAAFNKTSKTLTITDYSPATIVADQFDVMYSKSTHATDLTTNGTEYTGSSKKGVNILFNHALAQIIFKAKTTVKDTDATFVINEIKVNGVENKGTLTVVNDLATGDVDGWTLTASNIENFDVTTAATSNLTNDFVEYGGKLLLIPQEFTSDDAKVSIKYTMTPAHEGSPTTKTVTKSIKDLAKLTTINANKKYIINLTIDPEEILFAPSIAEDWDAISEIDQTF